jgi:hypothetical protein
VERKDLIFQPEKLLIQLNYGDRVVVVGLIPEVGLEDMYKQHSRALVESIAKLG